MASGWSVCNSSALMPPINMEGRSECTMRATPSGREIGLGRVHRHPHGWPPEPDGTAQLPGEVDPRRCAEPLEEAQGDGGHGAPEDGCAR